MTRLRNSFTKDEIEDALLGYIESKPSDVSDTVVEGDARRVDVGDRRFDIDYRYEGLNLRDISSEVVITDFTLTGGGETFSFSGAALSGADFFLNVRRQNFERIENKLLTGDDIVIGFGQDEILRGLTGDDTLRGKGGDDRLIGGNGADRLAGGGGEDTMLGGIGLDTLIGGRGNDLLRGNSGADDLRGGGGDDKLIGNSGADRFRGDAGNDLIRGGGGADVINGGAGDDTLVGGGGADTFVFADGDGADEVRDFRIGLDQADLSAVSEIADFADLLADHLTEGANGAEIAIDGDVLVRFDGVAAASLSEGDFIF